MEQITMVRVEQLHPHEKNPRVDAASVAELVESIREHGIEVPLVAAPHPTDGYVVLGGHRRLTAALQVGLAEVPAQIREDLTDARDQLTFIATENLHRDQLTVVEESRLVQDMLDLGMTQAQVAKQTALAKQRVSERVKLSKLAEDAGDKVHRGQITVDDALVIAEYSDDPEVAAELEQAAGTYEFDYKVSKARRRREDRERSAESRKSAKKAGLRVSESIALLSELVSSGLWATPALEEAASADMPADEWADLLVAEHEACPGHAATILSNARFIAGRGRTDAGTLIVGCDQWEEQHPSEADPASDGTEAAAEPDPWDEITAEDLATAKVHRERHLAKALAHFECANEARDIAVDGAMQIGWTNYYNNEDGIELLQAITGVEGRAKVAKALRAYPIGVLIWLGKYQYELRNHHRYMAQGHQGSTYWDEKGPFRQLLDRTGYDWTPVEQQAILLATGIPHDATDTDGADGAEGGEAA